MQGRPLGFKAPRQGVGVQVDELKVDQPAAKLSCQ
jgi:hypothetical protein